MERRLAAILAADVVGYSRLMETDEAGTHSALNAHRKELIDPKIAEHHGRIVKLMGDGALVEFGSAVDALECAAAVQREMAERTEQTPEDRRIRFRIGINIGDVIVEGDDIYGDGVNVAARLEGLADPGGVCVARNVFNQVKNKVAFGFEDMGEHQVKNLAEPVQVYRVHLDQSALPRVSGARRRAWRREALVIAAAAFVAVAGTLAWNQLSRPPPLSEDIALDEEALLAVPGGPSIVVLPFVNLSGDPAQEFFSDGITEEIITALSRFRELHVLSRNAASRYKGQAVDIKQIGRELDVEYVLEGSVRRSGDTVRVTAQLVDVSAGAHLWAQTFQAKLTPANVFQVQDEITAKVVAAIGSSHGGAIAAGRLRDARGRPPQSLSAYECVLTAQDWIRSFSEATARRAYACVQQALEDDPNYAEAWATLSRVYNLDYQFGFGLEKGEAYDPAALSLDAARRAVTLEPNSSIAHLALARAHQFNKELEEFYSEARRTLALNPNDPYALGVLGYSIAFTGRWEEGVALVEKAVALNPTSYPRIFHMVFAKNQFRKGEYEAALEEFQRAFLPGSWLSYMWYAYTYGWLGNEAEASKALAKLLELRPGFTIDAAIAYYRLYSFEESYIDRMAEGLRRAGLPERKVSANPPTPE